MCSFDVLTDFWLADKPVSPHSCLAVPSHQPRGSMRGPGSRRPLWISPLAFGPLPWGEGSPWVSWLRSRSRWDVWLSWSCVNLLLLPDQLSHARYPTLLPSISDHPSSTKQWEVRDSRGLGAGMHGTASPCSGAPLCAAGLMVDTTRERASPFWTL